MPKYRQADKLVDGNWFRTKVDDLVEGDIFRFLDTFGNVEDDRVFKCIKPYNKSTHQLTVEGYKI